MSNYHTHVRAELDLALRLVGLALLLTLLTPVSTTFGRMEFVHDAIANYTALQTFGALAPALAGLLLIGLTFIPSLTRLGVGVAAAMITVVAVAATALVPEAWDAMFVLVTSELLRQPYPTLAALALLGSAGAVATTDASRTTVRALLVLGWVATTAFYLLPERGYPMLIFIVQRALAGYTTGGLIGAALLGFPTAFALIPALAATLAIPLWADRRRGANTLANLCAFVLPAIVAALAYMAVARGGGAAAILLSLRAFVLLTAATLPLIRAARAIAQHLCDDDLPTEPSTLARDHLLHRALTELPDGLDRAAALDALPSTPTLRTAHPIARWLLARRAAELRRTWATGPDADAPAPRDALRALIPLAPAHHHPTTRLALRWLHRPWPEATLALLILAAAATLWTANLAPDKGVITWKLGPPNPEADHFFGETLPRYVVARVERNAELERDHTSAVAGYRMRELSLDAEREALTIGPDLHQTVTTFSSTVHDLDVSSRSWVDSIDAINHSIRDLGLPYYVDADAWELHTPEGERRFLYLKSYRVERLHRFENNNHDLVAAIHLRRLDHLNLRSSVLGLSRDAQPFALVLLDEIDRYAAHVLPGLALDPPRCRPLDPDAPPWRHELDLACGRQLAATLAAVSRTWPEIDRLRFEAAMTHLRRRTEAWHTLTLQLADDGERLLAPDTLLLTPQTFTQLLHVTTPRHEPLLATLRAENDALTPTGPADLAPFTDFVVVATERHELQHQLDGPGLPVPTALYDAMGGASEDLVNRAARELSGYMAELILDDLHAHLTLAHLLNFLDDLTPTSAEFFAAATILHLLADSPILDPDARTSPDALATAWTRATALTTAQRRDRVSQAYQEMFGRALETLRPVHTPSPHR